MATAASIWSAMAKGVVTGVDARRTWVRRA
jgi:hypothetical protein